MLLSLSVKNFAIIEDIHIDFKEGMTVLTGETGAGKSLIIDTISLLLGQRADSDMIRYGEKKASIEGVFTYQNDNIDFLLECFGIPKAPTLTILREILDTSKNNIRLNGSSISLTMLKQIAMYLADVHIQNDTYRLFNPDSYLSMITPKQDEAYDQLFTSYTLNYAKYLEAYKTYDYIVKSQKKTQERLDYLIYERDELVGLQLRKNIDEELKSDILKLENYDKVFSGLTQSYECLENSYFSLDQIYTAASNLKKIAELDANFQQKYEKMLDCYYILDEIKSDLGQQIQSLDFDQEELNAKQERLYTIEKAKNKYKMNVDELLAYLEKITMEIDMVNDYDAVLLEHKKEVENQFKKLCKAAVALSDYRQKLSIEIEKQIMKECAALDLEDTKFEIQFSKVSLDNPFQTDLFKESGIDEIDFLISFNPGEPLKSLHKVASGGEMSRIMLAFKSYFMQNSALSLMVFDEIDTGVSGATAKKIANKMLELSKSCQVLCITHLPQVASIGDYHIHIYKELNQNRTTTHFKYLTLEERVEEVALMLSGDKMSLYALEHAKALLEEKNRKAID